MKRNLSLIQSVIALIIYMVIDFILNDYSIDFINVGGYLVFFIIFFMLIKYLNNRVK